MIYKTQNIRYLAICLVSNMLPISVPKLVAYKLIGGKNHGLSRVTIQAEGRVLLPSPYYEEEGRELKQKTENITILL